MNRLTGVVMMLLLTSALALSCRESRPTSSLTVDPTLPAADGSIPRWVTLEEARAILPFEIVLPSFLPGGVSNDPRLEVYKDSEGELSGFIATYGEDKSAPSDVPRLRIHVSEEPGGLPATDSALHDSVNIGGIEVRLAVSPEARSDIWAAWSQGEIDCFLLFAWINAEGGELGHVSDQMKADALKVIESMIEQQVARFE